MLFNLAIALFDFQIMIEQPIWEILKLHDYFLICLHAFYVILLLFYLFFNRSIQKNFVILLEKARK